MTGSPPLRRFWGYQNTSRELIVAPRAAMEA